jgi:hypothetical protein
MSTSRLVLDRRTFAGCGKRFREMNLAEREREVLRMRKIVQEMLDEVRRMNRRDDYLVFLPPFPVSSTAFLGECLYA